jgi:peroxiredoxin
LEQFLFMSSLLLWVGLLFNLILTLAVVRRVSRSSSVHGRSRDHVDLKPGELGPDFIAQKLNGDTVTLNSYKGRSVAFLFISPSCSPCRDALPSYELLRPVALRAGVEMVLVSTADAAGTQQFSEEFDIRLPVLIAPRQTNPFARDYKTHGTPSYCVIDPDGKVVSAGYPSMEWGEWKALTDSWQQIAGSGVHAGTEQKEVVAITTT